MAKSDDLRLTYIGGPTVMIEIGGLRFLTDPTFDPAGDYPAGSFTHSKLVGPAVDSSTLGAMDGVLLSHDHHFDNLDHAGRAFLPTAKTVITTPQGAERLKENAVGIESGQSLEFAARDGRRLSIIGTPARHGPAEGERGPVTGFLLADEASPEGPIYISGDTVWFDGVEKTLQRYPQIRLAILFAGAARIPVLDAYLTFTAEETVRVSNALPQATIVPVHYEGWKHLSKSKQDISRAFATGGHEDRLLWLKAGKATAVDLRR